MFQPDSLSKVATEYKAALNLIDVVYSLESCLHYQFIPLELFEHNLVLGMVNPQDGEAIEHISTIAKSLNYSFHIQFLEPKTHQSVLAAYLKLAPTKSPQSSSNVVVTDIVEQCSNKESVSSKIDKSVTLFDIPPEQESVSSKIDKSVTLFDIPPEKESVSSKIDKSVTLFDIPPEKESVSSKIDKSVTLFDIPPEQESASSKIDKSVTLFDIPPEKEHLEINELHEKPTFIISDQQKKLADVSAKSQIFFSEPQINNLPQKNAANNQLSIAKQDSVIDVQATEVEQSIDKFKDLPSKQLLQKLLAAILKKETGKLELKQYHHYGRIVYYYNELAHSSIEKLPLVIFEELSQELKKIAKLPLQKLETNKKVAIHKNYNGKKVVVLIEFVLGKFGEEAIIKTLSGKALQLYEQKQSNKTLEQAIILGQKLTKTLRKISLNQQSLSVSELNSLKRVVKQIEQQLKQLKL